MVFRRLAFLTSTILLVCSFAFPQTQPSEADTEKAKKKKELDERVVQMLEQVTADAMALRLSQNRAVVYSISGDLYWKIDEKRARELFRAAAAEIVANNAEAEREQSEGTELVNEVLDLGTPRAEVMQIVVRHDAELALELLLQTRSAWLTDAMARASVPDAKANGDMTGYNPERMRVSQEIALEQNFAMLAAKDDPDKLTKLIKDILAKRPTYSLIPLLQKLNQKDAKKADELAGDVIKKMVETDLAKNQDDLRNALSFLRFGTIPVRAPDPKNKPFSFSDAQLKELAGKLVNTLLQPTKTMAMTTMIAQAVPVIEKFLPEKIPLLKQRETENRKSLPTELKSQMDRQKLWNSSSMPEEILAQLSKMTNESEKRQFYPMLSQKIGQILDDARARKLIDQIPDGNFRRQTMEQFESAVIARASTSGRLDEARRLIGNLTSRKIRIQKLVALALEFFKKKSESDVETSYGMMKDARAMTNPFPDDEDEIADLMEVVKGYVTIEPDTAFRMFEPVIDQFNEIVQASAVLSKYNKRDRAFKRGELVMKVNGGYGALLKFRYIAQLQMLGKADLIRMGQFCNRFGRSDSRTIVRLYVLQGFLADTRMPGAMGSGAALGNGSRL